MPTPSKRPHSPDSADILGESSSKISKHRKTDGMASSHSDVLVWLCKKHVRYAICTVLDLPLVPPADRKSQVAINSWKSSILSMQGGWYISPFYYRPHSEFFSR